MNKLNNTRRAAIVRALVEGASIRSIARINGCDKDTALRLLVEVGEFCSIYQDLMLRNLNCARVEVDEIWSFVGAKEANKTHAGQGDIWTYTALCADSKLMISWLVGPRSFDSTQVMMHDLAARLANRVQLSTDGLNWYPKAVEAAFGWNGCDYATVVKQYGQEGGTKQKGRYSPSQIVTSVEKAEVMGNPKHSLISTSYVERSNLTMRMSMRRFTRLTNGFSKKAENHAHAVSLHFFFYNFCRAHTTLTKAAKGYKTPPAMAAGITNHVWTVEHMLDLMDPTRLIS